MKASISMIIMMVLGGAAFARAAGAPEVERLGVVQRVARVGGYVLSRGTEAYPPRLLLGLRGPRATFVINLKDGSSYRVAIPEFGREPISWPWDVGKDGKVFVACYGGGGLAVYDPVKDSMKLLHPIPGARWLRGLAVGPDGGVYVSDYPTGSAARYDPETGKVDYYGRQGGPFKIKYIYGYSIGAEGDWVYTATGKIPWYVVAYNRQTRKQHVVMRFNQSDHPEIFQRVDRVFLRARIVDLKTHASSTKYYRLEGGKAIPAKDMPSHSDRGLPGANLPQPELAPLGRNLALVEGGAVLRYRLPGEKTWRNVIVPVEGVAMTVQRIAPSGDGRLLIATGAYGHVFAYDPLKKTYAHIGEPASKNVYDLLAVEGKIYFCGYPNAPLGVFENGKARILCNWHEAVGSKHAFYIVRGADGRIYAGNHAEREFTGGSLGWYDPKTGKADGIRFPNDDCEGLVAAQEGRLIVYASDFSPDPTHPEIKKRSGQLIVYDTREQRIVRQFSPTPRSSAGRIAEVRPGVVLGITRNPALQTSVMYTADVTTGKVLSSKTLPAMKGDMVCGPDGKVYTFLGEELVRVDPTTLATTPLLRTTPGRMAFIGGDLYLGGDTELRRIRGVASSTAGR